MKSAEQRIVKWAEKREIFYKSTAIRQYLKAAEEMGELSSALLKGDVEGIADAIGDVQVCLTNLAHFYGLSAERCKEEVVEIIEKRTGKMVNGAFVKDEK